MLDINLLPLAERRTVEMEIRRRAVRCFSVVLSGVFIAGSVLLVPTLLPLLLEREELNRSLQVELEAASLFGVDKTASEIAVINALLVRAERSLARPARASSLTDTLLSAAGPDVTIVQLDVGAGGTLNMQGVARTRASLLSFEEELRRLGIFEEISFPLSNIVSSADVRFSMQGVLAADARL